MLPVGQELAGAARAPPANVQLVQLLSEDMTIAGAAAVKSGHMHAPGTVGPKLATGLSHPVAESTHLTYSVCAGPVWL